MKVKVKSWRNHTVREGSLGELTFEAVLCRERVEARKVVVVVVKMFCIQRVD